MLRSFWKVSFLKFDEDENQAFKDILLKTNKHILDKPTEEQTFNFSSNRYFMISIMTYFIVSIGCFWWYCPMNMYIINTS